MQVKLLAIDSLKPAAFNPKSRSSPKSMKLQQLMRSIERIGLIYPIAVDKDMNVIDGHRRLAACSKLGWTDIPTLIIATDSLTDAYAEVNANSCRPTGNETLQVWLKEPTAVTDRTANRFKITADKFGRSIMQKAASRGHSIRLFRLAEDIGRYVGQEESPAFLVRAAEWVMKFRNQRTAESYMHLKQPPKEMFSAIKRLKDLRPTYLVEK